MSSVVGADELLNDLHKLGAEMKAVERQMLQAGGEEMAQAWRDEIRARPHILTQSMLDHVKYRIKSKSGRTRAEITSEGEDDNGMSNSAKAYMLHYGTSKIRGDHWIDAAEAAGYARARPAMAAVLDGHLKSTLGAG